jgi:hypothetical protein
MRTVQGEPFFRTAPNFRKQAPAEHGWMKRILLLLSFILALSFAVGCGGMFKGKQAAEQGVADFHKLYNDGKLVEIYTAGHPKLKSSTTEKEFLEFAGAVHRKLGKVIQTSNTRSDIRSHNFTTTVVLTQNTKFAQGQGTETFTFQMDGEKAILVGYNINSKDLILK